MASPVGRWSDPQGVIMNKPRRKELKRAVELLEEALSIIELCKDEEQEAFDNLPDSFQESERGEKMDEYIYYMEDVMMSIENAADTLNNDVIDG